MSKVKQDEGKKGSLKAIQNLVNKYTDLIDSEIKKSFNIANEYHIKWLSPLKDKSYCEYKDQDFLNILGLNNINIEDIWVKRGGAQWDALAKVEETNEIFLIEAKANIPEIVSSPTGAKGESKRKIDAFLNKAKKNLELKNNKVDWSYKFYQYTNRLAHLVALREVGVKVNLIFLYFYNDSSISYSPKSIEEWESAILVMKRYIEIPNKHKYSNYIKNIFIDSSKII